MEPGQLIRDLLIASPAVLALVCAAPGELVRIYPLVLPQNTVRPALTYQLISRPRERCRAGVVGSVARVQLSAFAATYAQIGALDAAVLAALDGVALPDGACLQYDTSRDEFDAPAGYYGRTMDYLVDQPE